MRRTLGLKREAVHQYLAEGRYERIDGRLHELAAEVRGEGVLVIFALVEILLLLEDIFEPLGAAEDVQHQDDGRVSHDWVVVQLGILFQRREHARHEELRHLVDGVLHLRGLER